MGDPGRRAAAVRQADCTIHQRLSARGRRLRGCGAARLQGGRRHGSLSEGTTRSLPARRSDNESARGRDAANLRDGRSLAARSRTPPLALLNIIPSPLHHKQLRVSTLRTRRLSELNMSLTNSPSVETYKAYAEALNALDI